MTACIDNQALARALLAVIHRRSIAHNGLAEDMNERTYETVGLAPEERRYQQRSVTATRL
jgi:hypothetical protein